MHKLKDVAEPMELFLGNARHLGKALGPILYQLPPHWHFNRERLVQFLELLPDDMRHVFEFRDPTWITEEVLELLGEKGASRSEEHTSELQSLMRISYAVFCLKKKNIRQIHGVEDRKAGNK